VNLSSFLSFATFRMRSSACDTLSRLCARHVLCWIAFPLVAALGSTGSAADRSALFVGFTATMAASDFPRPCIIGFGSSPSRCGPPASAGDGQTRDIPSSDTLLLRVMCSSTPAGRQCLAYRHCSYCVRPWRQPPPPAIWIFRGSLTHPTQSLCTLRGPHCCRLTQHSLPGGLLGLTWTGLAPADRASFLGAFLHPSYAA
jgi:hypothetical protein